MSLWSVRQSASAAPASGAGATTAVATFGSNLSSGSKIIAWFGCNTQPTISSVKDTANNSLTQIGILLSQSITLAAYAMDTPAGDAGGVTAITVTFATASACALVVQEVSGLQAGNTAAMLDAAVATAAFTGSSASDAQPAYTTSASGEYLVAFQTGFGSQSTTPPAGYTADANAVQGNSFANCVPAYKDSGGGAESGTWTTSGTTQPSLIGVVAFKLAVAGYMPQQQLPPLYQQRIR